MAHVRQGNRRGTPRESAEHASGYTANGESEHTRRSARPNASARFDRQPRKPSGNYRPLPILIAESLRRIAWMQAELRTEGDPKRREKLVRDLEIRGRFLTKLMKERDGNG